MGANFCFSLGLEKLKGFRLQDFAFLTSTRGSTHPMLRLT